MPIFSSSRVSTWISRNCLQKARWFWHLGEHQFQLRNAWFDDGESGVPLAIPLTAPGVRAAHRVSHRDIPKTPLKQFFPDLPTNLVRLVGAIRVDE